MRVSLSLLSFLLLFDSVTHAKEPVVPTFPSTQVAPEPVGIVFPGFTVAAGVNAAALPRYDKGRATQFAFSPGLSPGDPTGAFASLAASNKKFGFNAGYRGPSLSGGNTHGLFLGGGYQFSKLAFGIGLRDTDLLGGFSPALDLGFLFGKDKGFNTAIVLYHVDVLPQIGVGMGYRSPSKYQYEATVLFPPLAQLSAGMLSITAAVTIHSGIFAFYIRTTMATQMEGFSHTLGVSAWVSENFNIFAHFTTPRTITTGTTIVF